LLFRIQHICTDKDCGYRVYTVHNIITDNIKKAILGIAMKCPRCNTIMMNDPQEIENIFTAGKNYVNFINNRFITYKDGAIDIDVVDLIQSGFSGTVFLHGPNGVREKFVIDSITMTVKKVK
jgi:hypothetical protein